MRIIGAASLFLLLLAGSAIAQTGAPPPPPADAPPSSGRPMDDVEPRAAGPLKSARFRLKVGRIVLGLTCPDDEPLKTCADFAMQLLDKAESMQNR